MTGQQPDIQSDPQVYKAMRKMLKNIVFFRIPPQSNPYTMIENFLFSR
jgi:hypothetical protein